MSRIVAIIAALFVVLLATRPVASQNTPVNNQPIPFTLTANGQSSPVFYLNSASTCSVVVTNAGSGMNLTPQATSDTQANIAIGIAQWATVSTIDTGSITTFGTYTGGVASIGLTAFRVVATAVGSSTVTGSIYCSAASISSAGGGVAANVNVINTPGVNLLNTPTVNLNGPLTFSSFPPLASNPQRSSVGYVPGIFSDNPANAACNGSTAGASCYLGLTGATPVTIYTASSGKNVYVTGLQVTNNSVNNTQFLIVAGTGTNCGTGTVSLYGPIDVFAGSGFALPSGPNPIVIGPAGDAVCVESNTAVTTLNVNLQGTQF